MFICDAARDAPNYGGRVPVDTAPGPVPVYRAFKKNPELIIEKMSCLRLKTSCTVWTIGTSRCITAST